MEIERRTLNPSQTQLRLAGDNSKHIVGYAIVFNSLSEDMGGWRERVLPGALYGVLNSDKDIWAFSQHDTALPIGRRSTGTLTLTQDEIGVLVDITLPDNTVGNDLAVSVARGDLDGMSFGFLPASSAKRWKNEDGQIISELESIDLLEVSPVTWPAYRQTTVSVRSKVEFTDFVESQKPVVEEKKSSITDQVIRQRIAEMRHKKATTVATLNANFMYDPTTHRFTVE